MFHFQRKEELQRVQRFLEDSDLDDVTSSPSLSDETPSVDGHRHSTVDSSEDFHSTSSVSLDYACNDSLEVSIQGLPIGPWPIWMMFDK